MRRGVVWHVCHMGIRLAFEIAAESRRWEHSQPVACATGVQIIKERVRQTGRVEVAEGGVSESCVSSELKHLSIHFHSILSSAPRN